MAGAGGKRPTRPSAKRPAAKAKPARKSAPKAGKARGKPKATPKASRGPTRAPTGRSAHKASRPPASAKRRTPAGARSKAAGGTAAARGAKTAGGAKAAGGAKTAAAARPTAARAAPKPATAPKAARASHAGNGAKGPPPPAARLAGPGRAVARGARGEGDVSVAGKLWVGGKPVGGVLHIDSQTGRIVRVAKSTELATHHDFGSRLVLPGGIDVHVHFREPGHTHKEDIATGSTAAAFGGVTAFVDMPNTVPATTTLRALREKLGLMGQRSLVDYGAWAGGTWFTGDLPEMLKLAAGVKTYLGSTTGDLLLEDLDRLGAVLHAAAQSNRPVALHCEAQRILSQHRHAEASLADHDHARPPVAEIESIYDAMRAAGQLKKRPTVHIAHAASVEAVEAALQAQFSVAVCPHHLLLDTSTPLSHAYGKMNPPLRRPEARQALLEAFAKGRIPILESDHAPHTRVEKEDHFHAAPSGVPGVETLLPVMLAQTGSKLPLERVVEAATRKPAELLGLADRGRLDAGAKADLAVFDLRKTTKVEGANLHSKCGWSPFEGMKAVFPSHTMLAGQWVVAEGELVGQPGQGQPLFGSKLPPPAPPTHIVTRA